MAFSTHVHNQTFFLSTIFNNKNVGWDIFYCMAEKDSDYTLMINEITKSDFLN